MYKQNKVLHVRRTAQTCTECIVEYKEVRKMNEIEFEAKNGLELYGMEYGMETCSIISVLVWMSFSKRSRSSCALFSCSCSLFASASTRSRSRVSSSFALTRSPRLRAQYSYMFKYYTHSVQYTNTTRYILYGNSTSSCTVTLFYSIYASILAQQVMHYLIRID